MPSRQADSNKIRGIKVKKGGACAVHMEQDSNRSMRHAQVPLAKES